MAVYVYGLLMGFVPNGVDYAQGRRDAYLKKLSQPVKYIITDLVLEKYLDFYESVGISREDMLSAHQFFTDQPRISGKKDAAELAGELQERLEADSVERLPQRIQLLKGGRRVAAVEIGSDGASAETVSYFHEERLIEQEIYAGRTLYTNYFVTAKTESGALYAKKTRTCFKNSDGTTAFDILINEKGEERYVFPDGWIGTKGDFLNLFFRRLHFDETDTILIDRPSTGDYAQPLLRNSGGARICVFLHSLHYAEKNEDPYFTNINHEYFYWFSQTKKIDAFLVSTEEQRQELRDKLLEHCRHVPQIEVIPVSGLADLKYGTGPGKTFSMLSVSRLDARKKIEWIIRAAAEARTEIPELTLDIYGSGNEQYTRELTDLIRSLGAESYIRLKGHQDVSEIYTGYEAYISASLWETLGLSLMEAAGSGNALIGLDVHYGNRELIQDHENGLLVPFSLDALEDREEEDRLIHRMAEAITDCFSDRERLKRWKQKSYEIAEGYLDQKIEARWLHFMRGR